MGDPLPAGVRPADPQQPLRPAALGTASLALDPRRRSPARPARRRPELTGQLTFDHERDVDRLAAGIRDLHPKRERGGVCREAYRLCCEELRSRSYATYLAV